MEPIILKFDTSGAMAQLQQLDAQTSRAARKVFFGMVGVVLTFALCCVGIGIGSFWLICLILQHFGVISGT